MEELKTTETGRSTKLQRILSVLEAIRTGGLSLRRAGGGEAQMKMSKEIKEDDNGTN